MIVVTAVERDNDGQDIFRQLRLTHVTPGHTVTTDHLLLASDDGVEEELRSIRLWPVFCTTSVFPVYAAQLSVQ